MAQVLASLHAAPPSGFSLEYGRHAETVGLYCRARGPLAKGLEQQLAAAYPDVSIQRLDEAALQPPRDISVQSAELFLAGDVVPIDTCDEFEDRLSRELNDPLAALVGALAAGGVWSHVSISAAPATRRRVDSARSILDRFYKIARQNRRVARRYLMYATSPLRSRRAMARVTARFAAGRADVALPLASAPPTSKLDQPLYAVRIRLTAGASNNAAARRQLAHLAAAFAPYTVNSDAAFHVSGRANRRGSLLSVEELAILFHPATATVRTERLQQSASRTFEPPAVLPLATETGVAVLGVTDFRRRQEGAALRADDRRRHLYVVGKTGTGKSTLLLNLVAGDVRQGRGVGLIDPHGDLIDQVLERIPRSRTNDLILFDPAAEPIAFNPLKCDRPEQRPLVAAGVLSAMKKVFAIDETNAPRLLYILRNVLLALVEQPHATLLDIPRLLVDGAFRRQIVRGVADPLVRAFWQDEFAGWNDRYRTEAIAPIQNKVGQFLTSPLIRRVFESARNSLDLRKAMDSGKILLVNLSHGRLGEDSASLLGALLVTAIEQAAKSRADVEEARRRDFYLYADEFQTYAGTESLSIILSQARKYRLNLCLANQLVEQMSPALASTVFGNVGSLCVMQVGRRDAEQLAEELGGGVMPADLIALPKYHAVLRILVDGEPTRPFTIRTLPPPPVTNDRVRQETIRRASRRRHAPRSDHSRVRPASQRAPLPDPRRRAPTAPSHVEASA